MVFWRMTEAKTAILTYKLALPYEIMGYTCIVGMMNFTQRA